MVRLIDEPRTTEGASDCATVDWQDIGPIAELLCDVDLYQPTLATLEAA